MKYVKNYMNWLFLVFLAIPIINAYHELREKSDWLEMFVVLLILGILIFFENVFTKIYSIFRKKNIESINDLFLNQPYCVVECKKPNRKNPLYTYIIHKLDDSHVLYKFSSPERLPEVFVATEDPKCPIILPYIRVNASSNIEKTKDKRPADILNLTEYRKSIRQ